MGKRAACITRGENYCTLITPETKKGLHADFQRCRREIEAFFHTLKNGDKVESLQLGSIAKIELALSAYMVNAWRLARLIQLARI